MSFSWGKGDLFIERIGEHVLPHLIPLQRMLDAGLTVACGSDWGPKNVFEHVALATTHEFCGAGRRNDGPAQRSTARGARDVDARRGARPAVGGHRARSRREPRRPDRRRPRSRDGLRRRPARRRACSGR
jgi:hypothetical protein